MKRFISAISTVLLIVSAASAQTDRGTITGTILDPAGAVIPNASVEAKNIETSAAYSGASTNTGNFTLSSLPAGTYEFSVSAAGFKKYIRPGIQVQVAETTRVDATLEVGATTDTVTINAEAPLLKTESGEISHQIDYSQADQLPLFTLNGGGGSLGNIRDPLSVITILPGADYSTDNTLRVNGMPSSSQAVRVEGQDATNGMWKETNQGVQQGVDAIQEVSIQTSNFAAEYGQVGGGYINYTMKSGTNQYHGSGYDYFQNEFLNAATPFTNNGDGGHIKNELRRNDYGFTVGGPLSIPKVYNGKDKTFFFFNFEQFRQSTVTSTTVASVPLASELAGNFTAAQFPVPVQPDPLGRSFPTYTVFDPLTARPAPNGQIVEDPFPNDTIPFNRQDPVALKLQALFPAPNAPGIVNNYNVPAFSNYRHTTIPSIKIDQNINAKMKVAGYYSQTYTFSPNSNGFSEALAPVSPTNQRAQTIRVNFDDTITPTLLLHLGVGFLYDHLPTIPPTYDQSQLWAPNQQFPANNLMPSLGGLSSILSGGLALGSGFGAPAPGVSAFGAQVLNEVKPTANANMTWVHGNHTFKFGGEMTLEGFPQKAEIRANGIYTFAGTETENPWEVGNAGLGIFTTGFPLASFLLGSADSLQTSALTDSRLGNQAFGFFVQDNWKLNRKMTLEVGIRYDYATLYTEQYGRMQNAAFTLPNPAAGGLPGTVIYQATCHCSYNHNYPYALGPRLGYAYQIDPKTVFRAGFGVAYSASPDNAFLSYSVPDFQTLSAPLGTGKGIQSSLQQGNPFAPGNVFGNAVLTYPNFSAQYPNQTSSSGCGPAIGPGAGASPCVPPESPFISISPNTGRLPRIFQWSIGFQREIMPNLVIDANYVGNRGAWWTAPTLDTQAYNALTPQGLLADRQFGSTTGINTNVPSDLTLLTTPISSPQVIARFPQLANPNNVYPGFPSYETLGQALRAQPQWNGVPPFLGPPMGDTWYDALQMKVTKRFSHGLTAQGSYTWQKELTLGANANTAYLTPNPPLINDVFNREQNKQISGFDHPEVLVITFTYTTPATKFGGTGTGGKTMRWLARDWTFGGVLRYQSGTLIETPPSSNNFLSQLQRGTANNPAVWGGGATFENYVPGQSCLAVDPNSHFDPTKVLALNANAYNDVGPGVFGVSAPYYINCRWQRQPAESLSLGRIFRVKEKYQIAIRAEFQNVFNRVFFSAPTVGMGTNTLTTPAYNNPGGALSAGYGFVNTFNGAGTQPRTGQLVARITF